MTELAAIYFDGRSARPRPAVVTVEGEQVQVTGPDLDLRLSRGDIRPDEPVARTRRTLHLPGGALLQTDDGDAVDACFPQRSRVVRLAQALERRWTAALASAVVTVLAVGVFLGVGLPWIADGVARRVPRVVQRQLGEQTLSLLERFGFAASEAPASRADAVRARLEGLSRASGIDDLRLEIRRAPMANAFALPGGILVVTDELLEALDDDEVAAVLAHEVGHEHHRHALRGMLRDSMIVVLAAFVTGDASSVATSAVAMATFLLESGYSREFETEADRYAWAALSGMGRSPRDFAAALRKLDARAGGAAGALPKYLSSHPPSEERIRAAEQAALGN